MGRCDRDVALGGCGHRASLCCFWLWGLRASPRFAWIIVGIAHAVGLMGVLAIAFAEWAHGGVAFAGSALDVARQVR